MILLKLLFYSYQSWRVRIFIEIQKNGWWKKRLKSTEKKKTETVSSEEDNLAVTSSSQNNEGKKKMSETGSTEHGCASATTKYDDENKTLKNIGIEEELKNL